MSWFESSKDKDLKKKVEDKYYECVGPKGRYEVMKGPLVKYCEDSDKVAIKRIVDLIKANIKDEEISIKQKLNSMMLLRDIMQTHNKVLGNYVVEKILKRLIIFAKFKKQTTDPNRGKDIFGTGKKKQEQDQAIRFHQILLECLMDWGTNWPKNADGPYKQFKENLDQLILEKVAMPPPRTAALPVPRSHAEAPEIQSREQQLETERRMQIENQRQLQEQYGRQPKPPERRVSPEPQQPTRQPAPGGNQQPRQPVERPPPAAAPRQQGLAPSTQRFLGGVHENFCLLGEMIEDPQPEILREIVKSIETELEKGNAIIVQLMDRQDAQSQKTIELITDDFELLDKIKKDIQVISTKPNKKQAFKDKYVKLLSARRMKGFMREESGGGSDRNLPSGQLEREVPKPRQAARTALEPTYEEPPEREQGSRNTGQNSPAYDSRQPPVRQPQPAQAIESNKSIPSPPPNRLQLKNQSQVLPSMEPGVEVGGNAGLSTVRRGQLGMSKETVKSRDQSQMQRESEQNSAAAFERFNNQFQPRQSASETEDFRMFEQKEPKRGSQQDFFGAKIQEEPQQPTQSKLPSQRPPAGFFQEPSAPSATTFPAQDFFTQQERNKRSEAQPGFSTVAKQRTDRNPFEGSERSNTEEATNPFTSQKPASVYQSVAFEPSNPFEEESFVPSRFRGNHMFESVDAFGSNPFQKSSKNLEVTNPFEQTVISEKGIQNPLDYPNVNHTEKQNPFSDSSSEQTFKEAPQMFGFAEGFKGRLDSMKQSRQQEQMQKGELKTEPDAFTKKQSQRTEEEFLNIFSRKQTKQPTQPSQSSYQQQPSQQDPFKAFQQPIERAPSNPDLGLEFFNAPNRKTGSEFDAKSEKAFEDFFQGQPAEKQPSRDLFADQQPSPSHTPTKDPYPSVPSNPFDSFPANMERVATESDHPPESSRFKAPNISEIASQQAQSQSVFPSKFGSVQSPRAVVNPYPSVDEFNNFQTISSVERAEKPATPRSVRNAEDALLVNELAKADPTNPRNNPYGNPLNQDPEDKVDPNAPLKPGETVELDFQQFTAVKKIGIPWNPFQRKSPLKSPTKNELYLKMQLDKLNVTLENLKKEYENEKQEYLTRNKDFLEVRSQYVEKLSKMQLIEQQKHEYSKMMVRFEEDIVRKEKLIAQENLKIVRLQELKNRKNDCLRKLFECKIKRNMRQEQAGSRGTTTSSNKFMAFNETARELHSMASAMQATTRSFRVDSFSRTLVRTRFS